MAIAPAQFCASPFDAIADRYDETFTRSKIGQAQRASVWKELETAFRPGDYVLELGCGTGVDACFLADRGVKVVACDNSPRMINVATRRVAECQKDSLVRTYLLAAEDIANLRGGEVFDGAFSNFGALNCVEDLPLLARNLAVLLKPGSTALLCWMGPHCLWEVVWYLGRGDPRKAFRRFRRGGVTARLAEGTSIRVHYPSVRFLARTFSPEFQLKSIKGIGVSVPPSYLEPWASRFPHLFGLSVRTDLVLGRCFGFRSLADHVLLEFRRNDLRACH
ncbi:MAG TPA: methyltransferase domain-containing protein [Terriglobales bacterium]|jgi:SAM-dependent methyltransferase|nr:methyltransferase domain-containing protein [Terriglobales bacterium]